VYKIKLERYEPKEPRILLVCSLELVKNELSFMSKENNERNKKIETSKYKRERK